MDLTSLLTVEMVMMASILVIIITTAITILIKIGPLKGFSEIKMGKLELKRGKEDIERDNRQDETLEKIKKALEDDRSVWKARIQSLDGEICGIKTDIESIKIGIQKVFSILVDHEDFMGKTSEGTLENMLFNENVSVFKRLKSFKRLIAMGKNGKIRAKGFDLILNNKETWEAVQESDLKLSIINKEYFASVMDDIEKRIFRY